MTKPYRKKLIEVSLPLQAINGASSREKSIRHGHPSTLHLWWARRPLASCRSVLFASLVDDPESDPEYRGLNGSIDLERAGAKRAQLFNLIEELVAWKNSTNPLTLNKARAEIARCVASRKIELGEFQQATIISGEKKGQLHPKGAISGDGITAYEIVLMKGSESVVNAFLTEYAPPVLDPFCGGGSIPLEAQRLGLRAYASDLNPVPILITKALIEIPPKFSGQSPVNPDWTSQPDTTQKTSTWEGATGLAKDVQYYGKWMRDEAEKRIGHLYPKIEITPEMVEERPDLKPYAGQSLTIIAWLWARTVKSPNPAFSEVHVPLASSFVLSSKSGKEAYVEPVIDGDSYRFTVKVGKPPAKAKKGTTAGKRKGFNCLLSGTSMGYNHIRGEAKAGRMGEKLMVIVAEGTRGRVYLSPTPEQEAIVLEANLTWKPNCEMPKKHRNFQPPVYGMTNLGDLFTSRQLVALTTFSDLVGEARERIRLDAVTAGLAEDNLSLDNGGMGAKAYAEALSVYLAFAVDKCADRNSNLCGWDSSRDSIRGVFGRHALPMVWDFAESNPIYTSAGSYSNALDQLVKVIQQFQVGRWGSCIQANAVEQKWDTKKLISTDPPYYDNIGYADLSDFFYVWLRRSLQSVYPNLLTTTMTPKTEELIATPYRHEGSTDKARDFFETGLGRAFTRMQETQIPDYPFTVYYAFKQSETDEGEATDEDDDTDETTQTASTGWETMLAGLIQAGFTITGTWPMRTELGNRMIGQGANALASSIVLVCRSRPANAPTAIRKQFRDALRKELPEALKNLQHGNIAPVDLAQSAIGPGMAVFTRYAKVIEGDGSAMSVRTALGLVNQTLDEVLAEQEGNFDSDTRWAINWFEQTGTSEDSFGVAETLSKAKNTAVNALVDAGVIVAKAGKVRLVKREELAADWNPKGQKDVSIWLATQHLIRRLDSQSETGAAELVEQLGDVAEVARDLAYRLYSTCERKKWAQEALAYNSLVVAWPELTKLAHAQKNADKPLTQGTFFNKKES